MRVDKNSILVFIDACSKLAVVLIDNFSYYQRLNIFERLKRLVNADIFNFIYNYLYQLYNISKGIFLREFFYHKLLTDRSSVCNKYSSAELLKVSFILFSFIKEITADTADNV